MTAQTRSSTGGILQRAQLCGGKRRAQQHGIVLHAHLRGQRPDSLGTSASAIASRARWHRGVLKGGKKRGVTAVCDFGRTISNGPSPPTKNTTQSAESAPASAGTGLRSKMWTQ